MRRYLQYHELLRDVRLERVREVMFFSQPYDLDPDPPVGHPEGPCLVLYQCASLSSALPRRGHCSISCAEMLPVMDAASPSTSACLSMSADVASGIGVLLCTLRGVYLIMTM